MDKIVRKINFTDLSCHHEISGIRQALMSSLRNQNSVTIVEMSKLRSAAALIDFSNCIMARTCGSSSSFFFLCLFLFFPECTNYFRLNNSLETI